MATAAARVPKRELAPDWRDALRESVRRFFVRTGGGVLFALAVAAGLALATHSPTDPSLSTAAGGDPANWIGTSGAYVSDALLLIFGLGSVLFVPVLALAGVRMMQLRPTGRLLRALLLAAVGAILIGVALSLTSGSAVSGLPAGWGGAIGLAAAYGVDAGLDLIQNPSVEGPTRLTVLLLFGLGGLAIGFVALGLAPEERGWLSGLLRRRPRERIAPPRKTEVAEERLVPAAPPKSKPTVAVADAPRAVTAAGRGTRRRPIAAQPSLALGDSYQLPTLDVLSPAPAKAVARS